MSLFESRRRIKAATEVPPETPVSEGKVFKKKPYVKNPEVTEIERILALPVGKMLEGEALEAACYDLMLAGAFDRGDRLLPPQATAVADYDKVGGGLYPISVGWGKTGISLMVADHAFVKGKNRILLLVPPSVLTQLTQMDIPWWRRRIPLSVPFHVLGGRTAAVRKQIARSGRRGCYIMPYSLLSTKDAVDVLEAIQPDCIIADEVHNLKNRRAGKTKRLMHFVNELKPEFIGMSGTITSKGIEDYHHLAVAALGDKVPMPISQNMAYAWGQVINADATPDTAHGLTGPLIPLIHWARQKDPEHAYRMNVSGFRHAYRFRLNTAPGVVATGDNEIGTSLGIVNRPVEDHEACEGWELLQQHIDGVEKAYLTPSGDEIDHAIHVFKWLFELSAGFYNNLVWPEPEVLVRRRRCGLLEAQELLARAKDHHEGRQQYTKLLRRFLQEAPLGMDTPMEVARIINQHPDRIPGELVEAYEEMRDRDFEGRPERDSVAVRVCPYKINAAAQWASERPGGAVLWYFNREMGRWLFEALQEAGLNPLFCPAGANKQLLEVGDPKAGGKGDRIAVVSIKAHHIGKNIQAFEEQLFVQWPRDAKMAEQVLGRLHRNGQEADHVDAAMLNTITFDHVLFAACLNDALYTHQTTGLRQKMVYSGYDPLPRIYSPEFLKERGATPKMLTMKQREMMEEKFGKSWTDRLH